MKVYKIRVILDTEKDVIREIAINSEHSLEDLHNAITNAFGFAGDEMASFYRTDENWEQGEEFPLFDVGAGDQRKIPMGDMDIDRILINPDDKMIYLYDFLNMWLFFVELIDADFQYNNIELPNLLFSLGTVPSAAPDIQFETEVLGDLQNDDEHFEDLDDDFGDFSFN